MKKRITSIMLILVMFAGMIPNIAFAQKNSFNDVSGEEYYAQSAEALSVLEILEGYDDGSFGAERQITRAEMAAVICRMLGCEKEAEKGETEFSDVPKEHWASGYINVASQKKIIDGDGDGYFRPDDNVKYEEAIKMVVCALGFGENLNIDEQDWSKTYLEVATNKGFDKNLKGSKGKTATRGDIAVMVCNGLKEDLTAPEASLKSGEYNGTQKVKLTTETKGAEIYYTTDGTDPTVESTKYSTKISISKTSTLKAIAVKRDVLISDVMSVDYTIKRSGGGRGGSSKASTSTYMVSFDLNYEGATGAPENQNINSGGKVILPPEPVRDGFIFMGWATTSENTVIYNFEDIVTSNFTLYAIWKPDIKIDLSANSTNLFVSATESNVYFYADLIGASNGGGNVKIFSNNGFSDVNMFDDGQYTVNGDDLPGDNRYTCILNIDCSESKEIIFYAKVTVGNYTYTSNELTISIKKLISNEEIKQMDTTDKEISEITASQKYSVSTTEEKKVMVESVLSELVAANQVAQNTVTYNEDSCVYEFKYICGMNGAVMLEDFDDDINTVEVSTDIRNYEEIYQEISESPIKSEENVVQQLSNTELSIQPASIGTALVLNAFENKEERRVFYEGLETDWDSRGLETTVDTDVTVSDFKNIGNYDVVILSMHGSTYGGVPVLCLNEIVTNDKDIEYADIYSNLVRTDKAGKGTYWILPSFFAHAYSKKLDTDIIFSESCMFMGKEGNVKETFPTIMMAAGIKTIIGYHNSVEMYYSRNVMRKTIDGMIDGETAVESLNESTKIYGFDDKWEDIDEGKYKAFPCFRGQQETVLYGELKNGSFEEQLSAIHWKSVGDVRVISKLGSLMPQSGSRMAILTTGIGSGTTGYMEATEGSMLCQTFKVPEGATAITFSYNVISEEPMEFVGSKFDDKFVAEITSIRNGTTDTLIMESVNKATWTKIDNINFDGGDDTTYQTGWKTVSFDLSGYKNQLVTIRFNVYDVGDSAYDTAALIDNIVIK